MSGDNPLATTTNYYKDMGTASRSNVTGGAMYSGKGSNPQKATA
jgi:hypothetical protein